MSSYLLYLYFVFQTDKVSMLMMMPDNVNGSDMLIERLSRDNFLDVLNSLAYQDTEILLPQLAVFTNALDLEPFFLKLGVKTAFNQTSGIFVNKTILAANHTTKSTSTDTIIKMKQNAYFSMSFITINSVGSIGTKLGLYNILFMLLKLLILIIY